MRLLHASGPRRLHRCSRRQHLRRQPRRDRHRHGGSSARGQQGHRQHGLGHSRAGCHRPRRQRGLRERQRTPVRRRGVLSRQHHQAEERPRDVMAKLPELSRAFVDASDEDPSRLATARSGRSGPADRTATVLRGRWRPEVAMRELSRCDVRRVPPHGRAAGRALLLRGGDSVTSSGGRLPDRAAPYPRCRGLVPPARGRPTG